MKAFLFMTSLVLATASYARQPTSAQQPDQQQIKPAAQQQTAHVLSAETHNSHHTTSIYNSQTGQWSHGSGTSTERDTEIQVGNLVYSTPRIHKDVQVGKDYPVTIETDKHGNARKLTLTVGVKTYTYRITGTREVKAN